VRLYAEDPANQFLPSSGKLEVLRLPTPGPHVRLDSGVIEGDVVTVHYDPMIAKLIVHERDRGSALARLKSALADTFVGGIKSNIEFLETLIAHPKLIAGEFDTGYLDRALHEVLAERSSVPRAVLFAATLWRLREQEQQSLALARTGTDPYSPWAVADAWRSGHLARRHFDFECLGQHFDIRAAGYAGRYQFEWESQSHALEITEQRADRLTWLESAHCEQARVQRLGEQLIVQYQDQRFRLRAIDHYAAVAQERAGGNRVLAPMPGRVVALKASVGQSVQQGEELAVMEAMKMELSLKAPCAGLIEEIRARVGQFVEADALLISLKAS
jgi:3-methylcrotonyl-CoA carboxylase alpha subunit